MLTLFWTNHNFTMFTYLVWSALFCAQICSRRILWRELDPTPLPFVGALTQKYKKVQKGTYTKQLEKRVR